MKLLVSVLAVIAFAGATAATTPQKDNKTVESLAKERNRLKTTTDPVARVKRQIEIGDLLLKLCTEAAAAGDLHVMEGRLTEYESTIAEAHRTMVSTGRDAHKKSAGFKDLEIALRRNLDRLEELGGLLAYDQRKPVEKAHDAAFHLRADLIKALFGEDNAPARRP